MFTGAETVRLRTRARSHGVLYAGEVSKISTRAQAWKHDAEGKIRNAKHDLFRLSTSFSTGPMMQRSGRRLNYSSSEDLGSRSGDSVVVSGLPTVVLLFDPTAWRRIRETEFCLCSVVLQSQCFAFMYSANLLVH